MTTTTSLNVMKGHPTDYNTLNKAWKILEHAQLAQYKMHLYRVMRKAAVIEEIKKGAMKKEKEFAKMYWKLWNEYKELMDER